MRFVETTIPGAYVVELEPLRDERGWFARTFCRDEFTAHGLEPLIVQCNISFSDRAGTLRGMHFQQKPHGESKLVRCTRGAIYDVILDIRPASVAYRRWFAVELTPENGRMLYIPVGVAHGFQTLVDASEVHYQMGHEHVSQAARGVRFDDPAFNIEWPDPPGRRIVSQRDQAYADFSA